MRADIQIKKLHLKNGRDEITNTVGNWEWCYLTVALSENKRKAKDGIRKGNQD